MTRSKKNDALAHVREICMAFPATEERLSHGAPTFFAGGKKTFVMFMDDHHGDGRLAIWCAAPPGVQPTLVDEEPDRFFVPPYVGNRGWVGVRLDRQVDWDEIAAIVEDGYRMVAPKRRLAELDDPTRARGHSRLRPRCRPGGLTGCGARSEVGHGPDDIVARSSGGGCFRTVGTIVEQC